MRVLNELKPGLDEKIYENALVLELGELGLSVEQQRRFDVHYKGQSVGLLVPDLIVDGKVIVDAKVVTAFNESHIAQMIGYLAITDRPRLSFKLTFFKSTSALFAQQKFNHG